MWLSPKASSGKLPGPYTEGQPEPVTVYGGIGEDTGGRWMHFYVPDCLDFSLDQDALYRENESIQWNEQHAQRYRLLVTENFRLAVSVEPAGDPAARTAWQA